MLIIIIGKNKTATLISNDEKKKLKIKMPAFCITGILIIIYALTLLFFWRRRRFWFSSRLFLNRCIRVILRNEFLIGH